MISDFPDASCPVITQRISIISPKSERIIHTTLRAISKPKPGAEPTGIWHNPLVPWRLHHENPWFPQPSLRSCRVVSSICLGSKLHPGGTRRRRHQAEAHQHFNPASSDCSVHSNSD